LRLMSARVKYQVLLFAFLSFILLQECARIIPSYRIDQEQKRYPIPLIHAHAHNDYMHTRPLYDALKHGFTSIEADIHLVDGKLLVAHDKDKTQPDRTLQSLYLEPLKKLIRQHNGHVYPGWPQVTLLIDIKSDADSTYRVLRDVLKTYREILTVFTPEKRIDGPVMVIISGNRPIECIKHEKICYAGLDGRLSDLNSSYPVTLMPLISDKWTDNFKWTGMSAMPDSERHKLSTIVQKAHQKGQKVRFWGTPDNSAQPRYRVWETFLKAKVDLINTDDLQALEDFLLKQ